MRNRLNRHDFNAEGGLEIEHAQPLMMTGSKKGMNFCTLKDIGKFEPFGAMFPDGGDPLSKKYAE
ncbi:MAG: hypothetical protein CSA23_00230 [Deltaproteobacteria bacterium]|nr:MAG: hypothetical protein CSA23_00230 [Deltaproteobacteria bacterium]